MLGKHSKVNHIPGKNQFNFLLLILYVAIYVFSSRIPMPGDGRHLVAETPELMPLFYPCPLHILNHSLKLLFLYFCLKVCILFLKKNVCISIFAFMYVHTCMLGVHRGQKKALNSHLRDMLASSSCCWLGLKMGITIPGSTLVLRNAISS